MSEVCRPQSHFFRLPRDAHRGTCLSAILRYLWRTKLRVATGILTSAFSKTVQAQLVAAFLRHLRLPSEVRNLPSP